jgi:uracil-DNA glycosylase family 4
LSVALTSPAALKEAPACDLLFHVPRLRQGAAVRAQAAGRGPHHSQRLRYRGAVPDSLEALATEVVACRRCPRLVSWREQVARERRAAFREQTYWGRPVPGFGDPRARVILLGLAPAAHGGNRTGRVFTGDRSGDFLFAALWRTGFANVPASTGVDDGLRLRGAWVTAAVRCAPPANKPTRQEADRCLPWSVRELLLLRQARVLLCLGAFAWDAALRLRGSVEAEGAAVPAGRPPARPKFAHGAISEGARLSLLGCYHPSQQNTFTGRLTEAMLDEVLRRSREMAGLGRAGLDRAGGGAPSA